MPYPGEGQGVLHRMTSVVITTWASSRAISLEVARIIRAYKPHYFDSYFPAVVSVWGVGKQDDYFDDFVLTYNGGECERAST